MNLVNSLLKLVVSKVKAEPAVAVGLVVSAIVAVAGHFHVVLNPATLKEVLTPLIVAVLTRQFVVPANKVVTPLVVPVQVKK